VVAGRGRHDLGRVGHRRREDRTPHLAHAHLGKRCENDRQVDCVVREQLGPQTAVDGVVVV
jgi:hypothetical protein